MIDYCSRSFNINDGFNIYSASASRFFPPNIKIDKNSNYSNVVMHYQYQTRLKLPKYMYYIDLDKCS